MMHTIYVTEIYDCEEPLVYQAQVRDEDISTTDSLTDWLNGTLVNLYLEDCNSQYTSEEDEVTGEGRFATVFNGLLIDFRDMINIQGGYSKDTVYIYGDGCIYVFKIELYKAPYYKDV